MEKNSISIYFVKSAISKIREQPIDINGILIKCGINPVLLETPNARVSAEQFSTLWLTVAAYLNDEFFGQDSHCMKVGSFSLLCRTLIHCKTLKAALQQMLRFFNLLLDDYHSELVVEGQYSQIRITEHSTQYSPRVFGHETLLILQHGIACWLVGRRIPILLAGFTYAEPVYSEEYQRMYSSELQFNQSFTTLTFDTDYLKLPVIQTERTVIDFIQQAPTNIVLKYKNHSSFSATIRHLLRATPIAEWPDFDTFAMRLNMTRSTLRRRLQEEGQPFQAIKDQLRRDRAMAALGLPDKTIMEISNDLGFAEPSAFYRAFKKWTNHSPAEYRQLTSVFARGNN
jgi:AraC-like DNA-binding protein